MGEGRSRSEIARTFFADVCHRVVYKYCDNTYPFNN